MTVYELTQIIVNESIIVAVERVAGEIVNAAAYLPNNWRR
jgi:hypothetical protein